MFYRLFIFLCLGISFLGADILSFEELNSKPRSLAKDYYIYRLLSSGKLSKSQARILRDEIYRNKGKLRTKMDAFLGISAPKTCPGVNASNILSASDKCKEIKLTPKFIAKLPTSTIKALLGSNISMDLKNLINGMKSDDPARYFLQTRNSKNFYKYYNSLSQSNKNALFNLNLSGDDLVVISSDDKGFKNLLNDIVINGYYPNLSNALINMKVATMGGDNAFLLGVNAVKLNQESKAIKFFQKSVNDSKSPLMRDNARFWIYLINDDKNILNQLASSSDYNIYALYAKELLGRNDIKVIVPNPTKASAPDGYDYTDPFAFVELKAKVGSMNKTQILNLAKKFDTLVTTGEYSYLSKLAIGGADNYYPVAFRDLLSQYDSDRQALMLAIGRQESRFIPGSVSISFALGMMQFMPFVADEVAKKLKMQNFDPDEMFKPEIAYKFANYHLSWMKKSLYNPVFIAYAYNGGVGFTKKMLKGGELFQKGKFEPFLSMELVPYAESRDYGKRVLANYVVYKKILGDQVSIIKLINDLLIPSNSYSI